MDEGVEGWPEHVQTAGIEDDVHFLAFPQGDRRVRLYLGWAYAAARRRRVHEQCVNRPELRAYQVACIAGPEMAFSAGFTPERWAKYCNA